MTRITDRLNLRVFGFAILAFIGLSSYATNAQMLTQKQLTQLEFVKDETGKVTKVILYQGGQKMEGPKIK